MAAKESTIDELGEMLTHIVEHMATKDDLQALRSEFKDDVSALTGDITRLDAKIDHINEKLGAFENNEIDKRLQLEVRISTIEKHLGINRRVAA